MILDNKTRLSNNFSANRNFQQRLRWHSTKPNHWGEFQPISCVWRSARPSQPWQQSRPSHEALIAIAKKDILHHDHEEDHTIITVIAYPWTLLWISASTTMAVMIVIARSCLSRKTKEKTDDLRANDIMVMMPITALSLPTITIVTTITTQPWKAHWSAPLESPQPSRPWLWSWLGHDILKKVRSTRFEGVAIVPMSKPPSWAIHGDDQSFFHPNRDHLAQVLEATKQRGVQSRPIQQSA